MYEQTERIKILFRFRDNLENIKSYNWSNSTQIEIEDVLKSIKLELLELTSK